MSVVYPYPYYNNVDSMYQPDYWSRNLQENYQQVFHDLQQCITRELSVGDLYKKLSKQVPTHRNELEELFRNKEANVNQLANLYVILTGAHPTYERNEIKFTDVQDGLQKAYEKEVKGYEQYQQNVTLMERSLIGNVYTQACYLNNDNTQRLADLNKHMSTDYGPDPFAINIEEATKKNDFFRTALWTGEYLQLTLMSINVGDDIGLEVHQDHDQFIRIEHGQGLVEMGDRKDQLDYQQNVSDNFAIFIPAGKWHNVTNTGQTPLKLYSIYAPPEHPLGTVHETKAVAMAAEENHN